MKSFFPDLAIPLVSVFNVDILFVHAESEYIENSTFANEISLSVFLVIFRPPPTTLLSSSSVNVIKFSSGSPFLYPIETILLASVIANS